MILKIKPVKHAYPMIQISTHKIHVLLSVLFSMRTKNVKVCALLQRLKANLH